MVEEESILSVVVVPREQLPPGVTISKVPTTPAEAVAFELVPIEPIPPVTPVPIPPVTPVPIPPVPPIPEIIKLPEFLLVPVEAGDGEYLGVIYAIDKKQSLDLTIAKFGGIPEEYIISKWNEGPEPYFVIRKSVIVEGTSSLGTSPLEDSKLTIPETKTSKTWIAKCPSCLAEITVPVEIKETICPICKTLITQK